MSRTANVAVNLSIKRTTGALHISLHSCMGGWEGADCHGAPVLSTVLKMHLVLWCFHLIFTKMLYIISGVEYADVIFYPRQC